MGKLQKAKAAAPHKDKLSLKPKVAAKKTVKEKIRKSLGLKNPKQSSIKSNKHERLAEILADNSVVKLTSGAKKEALKVVEKPEKKALKTKKRRRRSSETEDCTPGRYVLNKTQKSQEAHLYSELEDKYQIKGDCIKSAFKAVKQLLEDEANKHSRLFQEEQQPIFLQITCVKIPKCPDRIARLPLQHSLYSDSSEICFIASDVKQIPLKETEQVSEYYENFLASKNIKNIKTVLPLYQLKTEYSEFELKRRLVELYDVFLVDGRISGKVAHILGKIFYKKRKLPIPIKLDSKDLRKTIENALLKTPIHLHAKGDTYILQIGHTNMDEDEKVANFWSVVQSLEKEFPGGWENVRSLHLKGATTIAIPVYLTLKMNNVVKTPVVEPKRPKAFVPVSDELSTTYNRKVKVYPTGEVVTEPLKGKSEVSDQDESEAESFSEQDADEYRKSKRSTKRKKGKQNGKGVVENDETSRLQKFEDQEGSKVKNKQHKKQKSGKRKRPLKH